MGSCESKKTKPAIEYEPDQKPKKIYEHPEQPVLENVSPPIQSEYPTLEEIQAAEGKTFDVSEECPICLEKYSEEKKRCVIICKHCFCEICITQALKINPHCPLCRKPIPQIEKQNQNDVKEGADFVMVERPPVSFHDWNVNVVRNAFARDPVFTQNNQNTFGSDDFFSRARGRLEVFNHDPFFVRSNFHNVFQNDPFFNRNHTNDVFKNDPFFTKDHNDVFRNDPFFNKDHTNDVFKNDPFFNKDHTNDVFKNDPFFNKNHTNDVFKNDPFFNRPNNNFGSGFSGGFFK